MSCLNVFLLSFGFCQSSAMTMAVIKCKLLQDSSSLRLLFYAYDAQKLRRLLKTLIICKEA